MPVTLRQLRAMVAVAQSGSIGRAAALMHLSQPSLTVQLRELERALGVRVFDRGARGAQPTEAGRELVAAFERILGDLDAVVEGAREAAAQRSGLVRLASLPSIGATILPDALVRLRDRSPRIRVIIHDAVAQRVAALVKSGAAEIGIGAEIEQDPELEAAPLFEDRMMAIFPADHAFGQGRAVALGALAAVPLIMGEESSVRALVDRACAAVGLCFVPAYEITYISTLMGMLRAGLGIGVLPASAVDLRAEPTLRALPIEQPPILRRIVLFRRAGRSLSPAAEAFLHALSDSLAQITADRR